MWFEAARGGTVKLNKKWQLKRKAILELDILVYGIIFDLSYEALRIDDKLLDKIC